MLFNRKSPETKANIDKAAEELLVCTERPSKAE